MFFNVLGLNEIPLWIINSFVHNFKWQYSDFEDIEFADFSSFFGEFGNISAV